MSVRQLTAAAVCVVICDILMRPLRAGMRVDATTDGGGCGRTDRCLHELAKLEEMGLERAEEMYLAVIDLIRREQPNIIPYRRRGLESAAIRHPLSLLRI